MKKLFFGIALVALVALFGGAQRADAAFTCTATPNPQWEDEQVVSWSTSGAPYGDVNNVVVGGYKIFFDWSWPGAEGQYTQGVGNPGINYYSSSGTFTGTVTTYQTLTTAPYTRVAGSEVSTSCNVTILPQPYVDLKGRIDGWSFLDSIDLTNTTSLLELRWYGSGVSNCRSSASPVNAQWANGGALHDPTYTAYNVGNNTVNRTYTVTCDSDRGGTVSDDFVVTVPQLACSPAGQTVLTGAAAALTATGGNGTYAWSSTDATPATGATSSYAPVYATAGTKTVSVSSNSQTKTCTVTVNAAPASTGTIIVNSVNAQNEAFLTTWTLTGPSGSQTPGSATAGVTYTSMPVGLYNLSAAEVEGYTASITPGAGQNLEANGTITYTITYTDSLPPSGEPWVDLRANPTTVDSGEASTLTWTSDGIEPGTCVATGDWSKSKDDEGSESTGALETASSYTITCDKPHVGKLAVQTVTDTASVSINDGGGGGASPECSDGEDNDADTNVDYPADLECEDAADNLEAALPPPPPTGDDDDVVIGACGDGFDNDGDGTIDEADSGCDSGDGTEQSEPDIREI